MKRFLTALSIFYLLPDIKGYFSTVSCPPYSESDILRFHEFGVQSLDCTLSMSCRNPFQLSSSNSIIPSSHCLEDKFYDDDILFDCDSTNGDACSMRPKVTLIRNWNIEVTEHTVCSNYQASSGSNLLPFPGNCSLFYKCDWGSAIVFECPRELHFNQKLQVCDWPWQAQCDSTWNGCPRPYPRCPSNYPRALYLPHPHVCNQFYQCDWGKPHLQTCPTGLHFNPTLKICDWPYKANCQVC